MDVDKPTSVTISSKNIALGLYMSAIVLKYAWRLIRNVDFMVTKFFNVKYLENDTRQVYLQQQIDRKSYMRYQTVPFSVTVNYS